MFTYIIRPSLVVPFLSHPPAPARSIPRRGSDRTVHFKKKRDHMTLQVISLELGLGFRGTLN